MFGGILPPILPTIRAEFSLSLPAASAAMVVLMLAANGVQIFSGNARADKTRPTLLSLGLLVTISICMLSLLSRTGMGLSGLILLAVIAGCGIAVTHPESLRAIHGLNRIPPAVSTSVFMTGGFLGFASAGAVSTILVSRFGLRGLYLLTILPILGVAAIFLLKIRLAVESEAERNAPSTSAHTTLPFWLVLVMAQPAAIGMTIIAALLPTMLNDLGFGLTFGGYSSTMFALGAAAGTFLWGALGHKKGELNCCIAAFLLTIPFLGAYLIFAQHRWAVWLLFGAGFCSVPAYVLVITLARNARGLNLGLRMGLVVGGTWGMANLVFMALAILAEHFGTRLVMNLSIIGFPLSAAFGIIFILKYRPAPLQTQQPLARDARSPDSDISA